MANRVPGAIGLLGLHDSWSRLLCKWRLAVWVGLGGLEKDKIIPLSEMSRLWAFNQEGTGHPTEDYNTLIWQIIPEDTGLEASGVTLLWP